MISLALNPELCYNSGMDAINKMLTGAGGRLTPLPDSIHIPFPSLPLVPARAYFFWSTL